AMLPELLRFAERPRTAAELTEWFAGRADGDKLVTACRMLRQYAPLWHAPVESSPWSYASDKRQLFVAAQAGRRPGLRDPEAVEEGLRVLIRRYLAGFGPASV